MIDLWPKEIASTEMTPPVTLLKQQATLLGEKTRHLVDAQVVAYGPRARTAPSFGYAFYLVGPAIGNYRYRLLDIIYPPEFYPVTMRVDEDALPEIPAQYVARDAPVRERVKADSEEAFKEILSAVFHAEKTKRVIAAIIAQSTS